MIIDNTEFKKTFNKYLKRIIVPFLKQQGYEYKVKFPWGLYWFEKMSGGLHFNINFQIKSIYYNRFEFYFNNTGKDAKAPPLIKGLWEVNSEIEIEKILMEIKEIIINELLPWFETVKKLRVNYKGILLKIVSKKLEQLNFRFKEEHYYRKVAYLDSRKNDDIEMFILLPFFKETTVGYDILRFEYNEIHNFLELRLLFYPETMNTNFLFMNTLVERFGHIRFQDEAGYKKIVVKYLNAIEKHADTWFEENRPKKRPDVENWGLFPNLDENLGQKKKYEKMMEGLPPLE
jgi:hypothetical protein